jgi:hypothetical protein
MIYENVEGEDFMEFVLSPEQYELLREIGVVMDFPEGLSKKRNLNVFIRTEEEIMPLVKGPKAKSKEGFSSNVKKEMEAGKPQKQAVAIAYSEARGAKKPAKKGKK